MIGILPSAHTLLHMNLIGNFHFAIDHHWSHFMPYLVSDIIVEQKIVLVDWGPAGCHIQSLESTKASAS